MDKKVWAIIAIAALHLTLMWFIRGSFQPEEFAHGGEPSHPDASAVEPNPYMTQPTLAADEAGPDVLSEPKRTEFRAASKKSYRTPPYSRQKRTNRVERSLDKTYAVNTPIFRDTIIYVKRASFRPSDVGERLVVTDSPVKPIQSAHRPVQFQKAKKKTIFKRAVPVIRKPYEWLKTLVSKL